MTEHADEALPGDLFFFLQGQADVGKKQQRVGNAILAESSLAQQPSRGSRAKRMNALIGSSQKHFKAQFTRGVSKASSVG